MGLAASKAASSPKGGKIEQFSLAGLDVCAASRQDALTGQGTGGTGRATTHCLQVPGFSVTQTVLEMGLK